MGVVMPTLPGGLDGQVHLRLFHVDTIEFAGGYCFRQAERDDPGPQTTSSTLMPAFRWRNRYPAWVAALRRLINWFTDRL